MTDKTIDSTQPESKAIVEDLPEFSPGTPRHVTTEAIDRDDPPVADLARELPEEAKHAVQQEGTWAPDGDANGADDAEEIRTHFAEND